MNQWVCLSLIQGGKRQKRISMARIRLSLVISSHMANVPSNEWEGEKTNDGDFPPLLRLWNWIYRSIIVRTAFITIVYSSLLIGPFVWHLQEVFWTFFSVSILRSPSFPWTCVSRWKNERKIRHNCFLDCKRTFGHIKEYLYTNADKRLFCKGEKNSLNCSRC